MQKFHKDRHFYAAKGALRPNSPVTASPDPRSPAHSPRRPIPGTPPADHLPEVLIDHRTYGVRQACGKTVRRILSVYTCATTGVVLHYAFDTSPDTPVAAGAGDFFDIILIGSRPGTRRKSPR